MPHPTPVQIVYGSVTVVSLTLLLLLLAPRASGPAAFLVAGSALAAGTVVALLVGTRGKAASSPASAPAPGAASEPAASAGRAASAEGTASTEVPSAGAHSEPTRRPADTHDRARDHTRDHARV
ncbi:hypothetical protein [Streptomyces sedi]|uniref:hypothetical protein n=1 Tax=Streptomyces sedi TaxID=555059 RepID=UPI001B86D9FD|nr:hypothetical protein [Streptomyces sedi]